MMTEPYYASVGPVFKIDGEVKGELARDVVHLEVEETTEGLKTLRVQIIGLTPKSGSVSDKPIYLDGSLIDFGKRLEVSMGPPGDERVIFRGLVSGLEAVFEEGEPPQVVVFAEDALMKLRMTRRMKTYEDMSDADIAQAIASEHGLSAEVDADGPTYDVVQQWNMSDLAFLRERAALIQAEIWLQDDTLYFKSRPKRSGTSLTLVRDNHLLSAHIRADLAHQRTKVNVSGYDADSREGIDEEAGAEAIQAEIEGGRTGPSILEQAFGERVSYRVRQAPLKSAEASAFARAEMLRRSRAFVTIVGVTRGSPDMTVGSRLELVDVGPPFEGGGYYATRVRHVYVRSSKSAYRTHFEAERPTVNEGGA